MEKTAESNDFAAVLTDEVMSKVRIPRKFEIFVEEYTEGDIGCQAGWRPVQIDSKLGGNGGNPVITINSQADMREKMNFYAQLGQRFRIIREIDPPPPEAVYKAAVEQRLVPDGDIKQEAKSTGFEATGSATGPGQEQTVPDEEPVAVSCEPRDSGVKHGGTPHGGTKSRPKIITIGDMQIKYDGDHVYHKQWVKLTATEAANFRVVADVSNKLIPMNGRHMEARRWILVENTPSDDDVTEELINA